MKGRFSKLLLASILIVTLFVSCNSTEKTTSDSEMKKEVKEHAMEDEKMMDKEKEMAKEEMKKEEEHAMEDKKMMDKEEAEGDWPIATLVGKGNYGVEGVANLKKSERKLKIMNFKYKGNAPDGYVTLGKEENGKFKPLYYISGKLGKINEAEKVYTIPSDVDLSKVNAVSIWCKKYSIDMGSGVLK